MPILVILLAMLMGAAAWGQGKGYFALLGGVAASLALAGAVGFWFAEVNSNGRALAAVAFASSVALILGALVDVLAWGRRSSPRLAICGTFVGLIAASLAANSFMNNLNIGIGAP